MFGSLASFLVRRRVVVLVVAVVGLALSGIIGGGVAENLSGGGFEDPASESVRAAEVLETEFGQADPNVVLLVTAEEGVDDPAATDAGLALTQELGGEEGIQFSTSYWTLQAPPLASTDQTQALVLARLDDDVTEEEFDQRLGAIADEYNGSRGPLKVALGGQAETFAQLGGTIEEDLVRAEAISIPITLVLLLFVFGSVVAALLPLAVGVLAILGTFLILQLLTGVTDVSIFALNLTTALGLGLAIDYSLFIVSRFREELALGKAVPDAVVRTVQTAGKTVAFSAGTVAISLAALLVFPMYFLRSFAYAGIGVVFVAAIGAVVVLPALLAVLGPRVDKFRILRRRSAAEGTGRWHRLAMAVMRRPISIATAVTAVLLFLGAPFLGVEFGLPDDRVLPRDNPARAVAEQIRQKFTGDEASAVSIVAAGAGDASGMTEEISAYATELSTVEGVSRVDALTGSYVAGRQVADPNPTSGRFAGTEGTWLSAVPSVEPNSLEGEGLVRDIRAAQAPFEVLVGGQSAGLLDSKSAIFGRLPLAVGLIAVVTFSLLFLMFGSLLVPAKALVLNILSLTAVFGAMVWVFQDGNLSGVLDFTSIGVLDTTTPILMFCIAFGLSMDYEVFLLSRIKEEHDRTGDNVGAVAMGLEKTGRIVTAAAALLAVVFLAFATSGVTFIKLFGLGLALAVILDATVVRATLVPALMRLAGEANWWAPRPLRRLYDRVGLSEGEHGDEAAPEQPAAPPRSEVPVS